MNYHDMALLSASAAAIIVALVLVISLRDIWNILSVLEKVVNAVLMLAVVGIVFGLIFTVVVGHDPARAAAFDPCMYPKPHVRPVHCQKP